MACPSPFDALRIATESLPDTIYRKASWFSVWYNYVQKGVFPKNTGANQSTFVIGNSEPVSNIEGWTDVTLSNNIIATMCSSNYTDVDVGYNEVIYTPRRFGIAGPIICKETLGFAHNPVQFITQYIRELTKRAKRTWEFEYIQRYLTLASKAICKEGLPIYQGVATFPVVAADSQLTQSHLDVIAINLIQDGATDADQDLVEFGEDGPIFPLVVGLDAAQKLVTNLGQRREDIRFAYQGKEEMGLLMKRVGATRVLRNFRVVPEVLPPRFTFDSHAGYVQVNTFEMIAASEGTVARITDEWKEALFEVAFVLHPEVFKAEMVAPEGAVLDWNSTNYMGEWIWKTGGREIASDPSCYDPLAKLGRHFAEFVYAPNPIFPNYGYAIMFSRCSNDIAGASCTYPYTTG